MECPCWLWSYFESKRINIQPACDMSLQAKATGMNIRQIQRLEFHPVLVLLVIYNPQPLILSFHNADWETVDLVATAVKMDKKNDEIIHVDKFWHLLLIKLVLQMNLSELKYVSAWFSTRSAILGFWYSSKLHSNVHSYSTERSPAYLYIYNPGKNEFTAIFERTESLQGEINHIWVCLITGGKRYCGI